MPGSLLIRLRVGEGVADLDREADRIKQTTGISYSTGLQCHFHGEVFVGSSVAVNEATNHPERWCAKCASLCARVPLPLEDVDDEAKANEEDAIAFETATDEAVRPGRGQGRVAEAQLRKAIEERAMAVTTEAFEQRGWTVDPSPALTEPFDLRCTKGREVRIVEVKGTRGSGQHVLVTSAEVEIARSDAQNAVFAVVHSIAVPTGGRSTGRGQRDAFVVPTVGS